MLIAPNGRPQVGGGYTGERANGPSEIAAVSVVSTAAVEVLATTDDRAGVSSDYGTNTHAL